MVKWGKPTSLPPQIAKDTKKEDITSLLSGGGSNILMEDGTLVFPLQTKKGENKVAPMIMYSNDGKTLRALRAPKVVESRGMSRTWKRAVGAISRVQENFQSNSSYRRCVETSILHHCDH
ncbi:group II trans-sialidase superfamily [Trypanosoma rangeli]|uniref:Group II trans-sialidase superfamily n=1 Tax=Trypanosoma rangeli TaxID=5698 RepID=A0A3R7N5N0_TRYRA|nr:group II trans-sialidase superfamily [Trypanosoma rangeli]RNE96908.1 group II trans-sialidase superfamily [Trypanosoma rangeli]|eukprot:RNE96908.1 group II trans-sialidase superfamily [Trypanosoma rangeli]